MHQVEIDALEAQPLQGELALTQEHPLIRSSDDYAELFARGAAHRATPSIPNASTHTTITTHTTRTPFKEFKA